MVVERSLEKQNKSSARKAYNYVCFRSKGRVAAYYHKRFLNGFVEQSAVYKLDLDISTQENSVKEAEKKMNKLKDDENSISKKIDQLQNDLKKNREDQEKQQQTIENELKKLEELRSKKSS